jgi:hypothetical protein
MVDTVGCIVSSASLECVLPYLESIISLALDALSKVSVLATPQAS